MKEMCGNIFCALHEQRLPTRLQGAPSFRLGCVRLSDRGESCPQSPELGNTLGQCCSEGCCSREAEKNRSSPLSQRKVGHRSLILGSGIAAGMGALSHPKPSAQKMDILNFHFPFKCHLDLFFLSPTLFHINCVQLQGVSENITLA